MTAVPGFSPLAMSYSFNCLGGGVKLKGVWSPGTVGVTSFDDGYAWLQTSYNHLFINCLGWGVFNVKPKGSDHQTQLE